MKSSLSQVTENPKPPKAPERAQGVYCGHRKLFLAKMLGSRSRKGKDGKPERRQEVEKGTPVRLRLHGKRKHSRPARLTVGTAVWWWMEGRKKCTFRPSETE